MEFLKASIADQITLLFLSLQTLKAVATATAAIVVPPLFTIFEGHNLTLFYTCGLG